MLLRRTLGVVALCAGVGIATGGAIQTVGAASPPPPSPAPSAAPHPAAPPTAPVSPPTATEQATASTAAAAAPQISSPADRPPAPAREATARAPRPAPEPETTAARRSVPTRLVIPDIKVDQPLIGLEVLDDGTLEAPARFEDVGWWQDGPTPGEEGASVMVGHVDSYRGPAVFAALDSLLPGAELVVTRADGSTLTFVMTRIEEVPKARFPADRVYRDGGPPGLVLITCGGRFDRSTGHYLSNVVVFADLAEEAGTATPAAESKKAKPKAKPRR